MNTDHVRVLKGLITVAFFVFISKFAGAIKEIVIAMEFGVGNVVDAYFYVFTLVIWIPSVWNSVMTVAFVPLSKKAIPTEQNLFNRELFGFALLIGGVVTIGFMLLLPLLVTWIQSDSTAANTSIITRIAPIMAPMILGGFLASYFSARLLAKERHVNTLMDGVPALCIAAVIILWPIPVSENHIAWSNMIGVGLQVVGLYFLVIKSGAKAAIGFGFKSTIWRQFRFAIGWMLVGQVIISFNQPIDIYLASTLGTGGISEFGYAKKILALLLGLGGVAVGRAILPVLSDQNRNAQKTVKLGLQWSGMLLFAGLVCSSVLWFVSHLMVELLFERGEFKPANTKAVSTVLQFGLLQLPFYFAGIVLVQLFVSLGYYRYIFYSGCLAIIVKVISGLVLVRVMGVPGLMLSTALMYFSTWSLFMVLLQRLPVTEIKD